MFPVLSPWLAGPNIDGVAFMKPISRLPSFGRYCMCFRKFPLAVFSLYFMPWH